MHDIQSALGWARARLDDLPHTEPLDAAVLLAFVMGVDRAALIAHPERPVTPSQANRVRDLVKRRAAGEPVAYLTGNRPFYDREFTVTPAVLIPRPETEHLIETALDWARGRAALRIVDVGTGSGAIAITLAAHLLGADVWAVDVSPDALDVAQRNAALHGVADRVRLVQGDLLAPLIDAGTTVDLIAANLPYIPHDEVTRLQVSDHEPRLALDGGPDGLDLIRRLLDDVPRVLAPGGLILMEIGAGQGAAVCALAAEAFPGADVRLIHDYAGHDRLVRVSHV